MAKRKHIVVVYYDLIVDELWNFWEVPEKYKSDVKGMLIKKGYGHLIIEEEPKA